MSHPLYAALQTSAAEGTSSFLKTLHDYLTSKIDTPEERDEIKAVALKAFDDFLAGKLGPAAPWLRASLAAGIDSLLSTLAG